MVKTWGFNTRDIDPRVRPQDDFYHYANGGWLQRAKIPPDESRWGGFMILRFDTEKKLQAIVRDLQRKKRFKKGTKEQVVHDFYASALDLSRRNKLGLTPLTPWLTQIEQLKNVPEMLQFLAAFEPYGGIAPWGMGVDQDMRNSERYIVYIGQSGLSLPDRDYYLKKDPESTRVRNAYRTHVVAVAKLMGKTHTEAEEMRDVIVRIETSLAKASMTKEDKRDMDKIYHKMRIRDLKRLMPHVDWEKYFHIAGAKNQKEVIVMQPEFLKAVDTLLATTSLQDWKAYLAFHLVNGSAGYLSAPFEKQSFDFYGKVMTGAQKMKPLWRRALGATNGSVGELLGQIYVGRYFPRAAKRKVIQMVNDLFEAYEDRINKLDWMSSKTKKKALYKLSRINRKLGYPEKWHSYKGLAVRPDAFLANAFAAARFEHARVMRRLPKKVDRKEWFMSPQTVNAYYSFFLNDIVFPAAILQPPFFSIDGDDALNYGAIGAVIGHEITHGFDDQGSKFDGNGNRRTWWTANDRKRFEKKADVLIKQFNAYTIDDGLHVNGKLTLGENIADLGGASIAFDAYKNHLKKTGSKNVAGFTPEQRFFFGLSFFEREKCRPEFQKMRVLTNEHSPEQFRVNGPASNLPEFYEAFGVKKGDKLYRSPKDRAKIW